MLKEMKTAATLPVITKPAEGRNLTGSAKDAFAAECRCADLYVLACPDLAALPCGSDWVTNPVIL